MTGLAHCVGDVEEFLATRWATAAHLHRGEDFVDLLGLDHVDHILSTMGLRSPAFRLVEAGRTLPVSTYTRRGRIGSRDLDDLIDVAAVMRRFEAGATIVLQGLHRYWPPVTALCRALDDELTHPTQANAYLTPPGSQGLRVHADAHDVLALQTAGRKQWVLHADGAGAPATADFTLVPGDCLYVPKGMAHAARTVAGSSLHLTIGIRRVTWATVLRRATGAALADRDLDAPLPPGFARAPAALRDELAERLASLAARVARADPDELASAEAAHFLATRTPPLEGQLTQLVALETLDDASVVRRRPHVPALLTVDGDRAVVALGDRELRLPAVAAPALRRLLDDGAVRLGDLAAVLDAPSRLVLVRRLIREGLLVVERPADTPRG